MGIKSLVMLDNEQMKNMKVERKFGYTFKRIYTYLFIVIALLLATTIVTFLGLNSMTNNYYQQNTYQGLLRIHNQNFGKSVWMAVATKDAATRQEEIEEFDVTMINNLLDDVANLKKYRGETPLVKALDQDVQTLNRLGTELVEMFNEGTELDDGQLDNFDELYEKVHEEVRPAVMDAVQNARQMTVNVTTEMNRMSLIIRIIFFVMIGLSVVFLFLLIVFMRNAQKQLTLSVVTPVNEVAKVAEMMSKGQLDVSVNYDAKDELGTLARDMEKSTLVSKRIVDDISLSLDSIASGDFTVGAANPELYLGNYSPIRDAMDTITNRLSNTMNDVREATDRVSQGASNMSEGSNELAEGATDQAAAVEELTASVATVTEHTEQLASTSQKGVEMSMNAQQEATKGAEKMDQVTEAMARITASSKEIAEVASSIEEIASQTKLLALNASIEAARAGESGRGFAVVAEEIGELAMQSNEAVQRTHELVDTALSEIDKGNAIVKETQGVLMQVTDAVNSLAEMMREAGSMANEQAQSMREINGGIEQISGVIQNNSATAEESSAVSNELTEQSHSLHDLVSQFRVK